jgi:hypothetical protein
MIPQWKMNGKDMRFNGETEIGIVEVRDLFDDLVVTLWVDQEESGNITVKSLGGIGNGRYKVQVRRARSGKINPLLWGVRHPAALPPTGGGFENNLIFLGIV